MPTNPLVGLILFMTALSGIAAEELTPQSQFDRPESVAITLDPAKVNLLMAPWSAHSPALKDWNSSSGLHAKNFWLKGQLGPDCIVQWKLHAPAAGNYQLTFMLSAAQGTVLKVGVGATEKTFILPEAGWQRVQMPERVTLSQGEQILRISAATPGKVEFKSVELCSESQLPTFSERARQLKGDASWMKTAGYGIMVQAGGWSYPQHGEKKPWPGFANDFDAAAFVQKVDEMGGKFLVWSPTWIDYLFPAPINAIREIMPARVSQRDLIADLIRECKKRHIRFMLYYHLGHDHVDVLQAKGWPTDWTTQGHRRQAWFEREHKIFTEIGQRYGQDLDGWFIDDACAWYPCDFEALARALKTGNPKRVTGFNSWIAPRHTEFQDFYCGEHFTGETSPVPLQDGVVTSGPQKGLQLWGCFTFDGSWGIHQPETPLKQPNGWSVERLVKLTRTLEANRYSVAINLTMYEDGSFSPESYTLLTEAAKQTGRGPWPKP